MNVEFSFIQLWWIALINWIRNQWSFNVGILFISKPMASEVWWSIVECSRLVLAQHAQHSAYIPIPFSLVHRVLFFFPSIEFIFLPWRIHYAVHIILSECSMCPRKSTRHASNGSLAQFMCATHTYWQCTILSIHCMRYAVYNAHAIHSIALCLVDDASSLYKLTGLCIFSIVWSILGFNFIYYHIYVPVEATRVFHQHKRLHV